MNNIDWEQKVFAYLLSLFKTLGCCYYAQDSGGRKAICIAILLDIGGFFLRVLNFSGHLYLDCGISQKTEKKFMQPVLSDAMHYFITVYVMYFYFSLSLYLT